MNLYRVDLLWHASTVHACLADWGAEASIDLATFRLEVKSRNRYYSFYPRFIVRKGDQLVYVERPDQQTRGFAGWLPYVNKRWPVGSGKFAFKDFCLEHGLRSPRLWRSPSSDMRDFIVKQDRSSSGSGMRGPFTAHDAGSALQVLPEGGYYEQFVRGRIVKAWYWEDRLVSLEIWPMPIVTGDGKSTIRDLIARAVRPNAQAPNWDNLAAIARYQGTTLDTVLASGQTQLAEFRYATSLTQAVLDPVPTLERYKDSPVLHELAQLGPTFWQGVPENMRAATLYSVDAIADADDKNWLLEMNCNPAVPPEAYAPMFERLFGARGVAAAAEMAQPAAPAPLPQAALPLQTLVRPPAGATRWVS